MSIGYRAVLRLRPSTNAIETAEDHLRSWLQEKRRGRRGAVKVSDWDGPGVHKLGPHSELHVIYDAHREDGSVRRLYRLVETNPTGRWVVSLYAAALPKSRDFPQTIVVEVDRGGVDRAMALASIDPPRIVASLLDETEARDGSTTLTGFPRIIRAGQAHEVVSAISDPERTASVVVAGSFAQDLDADWKDAVTSLTKQSVGVAATYVVYADAIAELDAALPESHRVGGGRVRTYLPNADLEDPSDSVRHKWLGPVTLQRSLTGRNVATPLQRRHAEVARRRLVEAELPADIRRTIDLLRRAETSVDRAVRVAERVSDAVQLPASRTVRESLASQTVDTAMAEATDLRVLPGQESADAARLSSGGSRWQERLASTLKRWLRVSEPELEDIDRLDALVAGKFAEVEVAEEQLNEAADREEELLSELQSLRRRADDLELDLAQAEQDELESERVVTTLRRRIATSERPQDAYVEPDDVIWSAPDSVEELVGRITQGDGEHPALRRVEFTGDLERALEVDRRYPSGLYATTLWHYVRVLYDFAEAKEVAGFSGNVHMYLTDDRVGTTKCSPNRHAGTESETVLSNKAWREERMLPVPRSVHPSELALMDAHFKPTHKDTFAPRMHYYDAVSDVGKIYIGYIGRHLTNKQT